ncbi:MAG: helix-turn-helix domain-containing protein [Candidatus Abyssobacteria bacterium SURF_5]|uniref:Helix-turn-helix domain-containing protein n=1 Tax=Abyssobacteria bacterium (strain SURF_5) TaxID=2093360 RepID=A0A3A4NW76_ABYX5|nr:MAG: helix-turn-helix domain-containing protein [Candidatus Abyssubacteria bacterium SURF_5]
MEVNFGYLLRTLRICAGLSLRELARTIDVSPTYLSLIENGKQPPPSASRIARIEQVLEVPAGYLLSIARGLDPAILSFIQDMPEALDFLTAVKERGIKPADLSELAAFVTTQGGDKLRQVLQSATLPAPEPKPAAKSSCGAYIWPYLDEELVFDFTAVREKEGFLQDAVHRICQHCNGASEESILAELLKREKIASTGIGHGIAVPHAYVSGIERLVVAFARIPRGLDFHAIDGEPVHMVLVLAGPRSAKNLHLLLLARIARLVRNRSFCQRVLSAATPREIVDIFRNAEAASP